MQRFSAAIDNPLLIKGRESFYFFTLYACISDSIYHFWNMAQHSGLRFINTTCIIIKKIKTGLACFTYIKIAIFMHIIHATIITCTRTTILIKLLFWLKPQNQPREFLIRTRKKLMKNYKLKSSIQLLIRISFKDNQFLCEFTLAPTTLFWWWRLTPPK